MHVYFFKKLLHSACPILQYYEQCEIVSPLLYSILYSHFTYFSHPDIDYIFMCSFDICISSSVEYLCPFLVVAILVLNYERYYFIVGCVVYKYFLPLCKCPLHAFIRVFYRENTFNFNEVQFIKFSFSDNVLMKSLESICLDQIFFLLCYILKVLYCILNYIIHF